ncbi:MAG: hypothetical protein AAF909_14005 [Pseudomonadota bacterium]
MRLSEGYRGVCWARGGVRAACALVIGLGVAPTAVLAGPGLAPRPPVAPAARAAANARASLTVANAPSPSETLLLRRRSDYVSEAEMIETEIELVRAETEALQSFNAAEEAALMARVRRLREVEDSELAPQRAEARALEARLAEDRKRIAERLRVTEAELRTTRALRDQAVDDALGAERERWEAEEERLERERDRLRELLERVSQLAALVR